MAGPSSICPLTLSPDAPPLSAPLPYALPLRHTRHTPAPGLALAAPSAYDALPPNTCRAPCSSYESAQLLPLNEASPDHTLETPLCPLTHFISLPLSVSQQQLRLH